MKLKKDNAKPAATGLAMGSILSAKKEQMAGAGMWLILIALALMYEGRIPLAIFFMFFFFVYMYFTFEREIDRVPLRTRLLVIDGLRTTVAQSFGDKVIPALKKDGETIVPALRVFPLASIDGAGPIPPMHQGTLNPKKRLFALVPETTIENVGDQNTTLIVRNATVIAYNDFISSHAIKELPPHIIETLRGFSEPHNLPLDTRHTTVLWVVRADPVPDRIQELKDKLSDLGMSKDEIATAIRGSVNTNMGMLVDDLSNILNDMIKERQEAHTHHLKMKEPPVIRGRSSNEQEGENNE